MSHCGDKLSDELDPNVFSRWASGVATEGDWEFTVTQALAVKARGEDSLLPAPDHLGLIPQCGCPAHLLPASPAHPHGGWKAALSPLCPASGAVPAEAFVALLPL